MDLFDAHLTAAELLNNFGVQKPMNFFLHLLHVRKEVDATEYNKVVPMSCTRCVPLGDAVLGRLPPLWPNYWKN